jgi:hypothetical protein
MRLSFHDGHLVATSNTAELGFILRLSEDVGALSRLATRVDSTFRLPVTGSLYYSVGPAVYRFRGGSNLSFDWWSRDFAYNAETNFGAGYIRCEGPIRLQVYTDGTLWYDTATDALRGGAGLTTGSFRLPAGLEALRWSVRLQGTYEVHEFRIAGTFDELKRNG